MKNKNFLRVAALLMSALLFTVSLVGCASRALPSSEEDLTVVGTVGEYEVLYEELRFLVLSYKEQLEIRYGAGIWNSEETAAQYLPMLREMVYEDIVANYAVLTLAKENGIKPGSYDGEVQDYMDEVLENDFAGDRELYKEFLKLAGVTDHYIRFTAEVDHIYEDLYLQYIDSGKILTDETSVKQYILQNFVYVASICLVNKTDEESEINRKKAEEYRSEVADGADINDYVKYTLDLSPEHCFGRGMMDQIYEEHAFALTEAGEVSPVFLAPADYLGAERDAWYFMQKLPLTVDYVTQNYPTLFDRYADSLMNDQLSAVKEKLAFVPNEYCESLDLLSIAPITEVEDNTDLWILSIVGISVVSVAVIGTALVILWRKVLNPKPVRKDKSEDKKSDAEKR